MVARVLCLLVLVAGCERSAPVVDATALPVAQPAGEPILDGMIRPGCDESPYQARHIRTNPEQSQCLEAMSAAVTALPCACFGSYYDPHTQQIHVWCAEFVGELPASAMVTCTPAGDWYVLAGCGAQYTARGTISDTRGLTRVHDAIVETCYEPR